MLIRKKRLNAIAHICPLLPDQIEQKENFLDESVYDIIQDISPNFNQSVDMCDFRGHYDDDRCSEFFLPILTEEGVCFTFNALNSHEIYTEE